MSKLSPLAWLLDPLYLAPGSNVPQPLTRHVFFWLKEAFWYCSEKAREVLKANKCDGEFPTLVGKQAGCTYFVKLNVPLILMRAMSLREPFLLNEGCRWMKLPLNFCQKSILPPTN